MDPAKDPKTTEVPLTEVMPDTPYGNPMGSVHRGFEVMELFSIEQRALTVGEVSQKLGYPQSSTSLLLHGLTELGYLQHDRHARSFLPTLRVSFLGMWLHQNAMAQGGLMDMMDMLASRSGHVAMLGMRNGLYAQYIHIASGRTSRVGLKPGLLRPLCRSAVGKVLLSTLPDDEVLRVVRNVNAMDSSFAEPVEGMALLAEIEQCRATGLAFSVDAVNPGASVIAARVPTDVGGQPLAIAVGVHTWELEQVRDSIIELLREAMATYFPPMKNAAGQRPPRNANSAYAVVKKTP